jgi:hypothetical protein
MLKRIVLVFALLLVTSLGLVADATPQQQGAEIGLGVKITQINGVTLQPGKVVSAGNVDVLPGVIYLDGGYIDETLEGRVVEAGLGSVDALRGWGLCEAELHAEALIKRGFADAIYAYPQNAPLHDADKNGNVTADDAAFAKKLRTDAERYDRAAVLARSENLPCTSAGKVSGDGNYVRLTGKGTDGRERTLDVPDYSVVYLPVEYFALKGECAADLTGWLKKVEATPVDAKPGKRGSLDTFTERDKAGGMSRLKAQVTMLQAAETPC